MKDYLCLPLMALLALTASTASAYTVGIVPQFDQRRIQETWRPVLDYVSKAGGVELEIQGSADIPRFEQAFVAGEFDFAYMNPYHVLVAHREQGYVPLLRDVSTMLYGIIVVAKDSPFQRIQDLAGKTVAFPAPNALGAALIPRAEFARKFHLDIKPLYVRSHSSVYLNVALGQADAGGGVQKTFLQQEAAVRDKLRILYKTTEVAPHPLVVHPRVPAQDRDKIRRAFLELGQTEQGRAWLAEIPIQKIGLATLEDYAPLKDMGLDEFYVQGEE